MMLLRGVVWAPSSLIGERCARVALQTCLRSCIRALSARPTPRLEVSADGPEFRRQQRAAQLLSKRRARPARLPEALVAAVFRATAEMSASALQRDAAQLNNRLSARHPPTEESVIQATAQHLEQQYLSGNSAPDEEKLRNRVIREMKRRIYHWQPITLPTEYEAAVYAVARLAIDFAGLVYCLREMRDSDPGFQPAAVLHYGSGAGAGVWAAREVWGGDTVREFSGIEWRLSLLELSVLLLRGGTPEGQLDPTLFFRSLLPPSARLKYPLVVSSHALCELPSQQARLETVASLWERTAPGGRLCVLEPGSNVGYQLMLEARDVVLRLSRRQGVPVHVAAPCPHELACPRFSHSLTPCHFSVAYAPLALAARGEPPLKRTPVSYVTLVKAERPAEDSQWPRVVQEVLTPARHTVCRLCTSRGTLEEVVATKRRHGSALYSCVRAARWGDTLPIALQHREPGVEPE